jgi:hypothetical protein
VEIVWDAARKVKSGRRKVEEEIVPQNWVDDSNVLAIVFKPYLVLCRPKFGAVFL